MLKVVCLSVWPAKVREIHDDSRGPLNPCSSLAQTCASLRIKPRFVFGILCVLGVSAVRFCIEVMIWQILTLPPADSRREGVLLKPSILNPTSLPTPSDYTSVCGECRAGRAGCGRR
jgi:hypothetical protein